MSPPAAHAKLPPPITLGVVFLLTVLAAALRVWQAGESLWLDELHTAWCATGNLTEVAPRATIGNQSPLFFWLEWLLVHSAGASELSLRLPSLVAGSLLPAALFALAWRGTQSSTAAIVAAALVAIDHTSIFYATEARPYALVQLLAVMHIAITAELLERPTARLRMAWISLAALLFHLHYTAALLIPAELAFWCTSRIAWPATTNYRLTMVLMDAGMTGLLCLPALANLEAIFGRRENWAAFVTPTPPWKLAEWFPWSLSVPLALAAFATGSRHRRFLCLPLAWLLVPATIAWLATATDFARLFFPRYLIASAPAAMLLAALCADVAPWRWSKALIGMLLVVVAFWNSGIVEQFRYDGRVIGDRNEDWRGAINWLNEQLPRQPIPVLVASGLIEADGLREPHDGLLDDYCLLPISSLYPVAAERADLIPLPYREPGRLEPDVRQFVRQRGGAWLVVRGSPQSAERVVATVHQESGTRSRGSGSAAPLKSFGSVQIIQLTIDH